MVFVGIGDSISVNNDCLPSQNFGPRLLYHILTAPGALLPLLILLRKLCNDGMLSEIKTIAQGK